jgi:hypothetical protein
VRQRRLRGLTWAFPLTCHVFSLVGPLPRHSTLDNLSITGRLWASYCRRRHRFACQCKRTPRRRRLSQSKLLVEQHKPHGNSRSMKFILTFPPMSCPLYLSVLLLPMKPKTQLVFVGRSQVSYINTFSSWGCSSKYAFTSTALPNNPTAFLRSPSTF